MWEINNTLQLISIFYSLLLGIVFCVLFDIFGSFRIVKKHSQAAIFFEDVIFFATVAFITFIFLLAITNGEIRGYILFCVSLGFIFFKMTFSRFVKAFFVKIFSVFSLVLNTISKSFYMLFEKNDIFMKNILKCFKKCLKNTISMLYTNKK